MKIDFFIPSSAVKVYLRKRTFVNSDNQDEWFRHLSRTKRYARDVNINNLYDYGRKENRLNKIIIMRAG